MNGAQSAFFRTVAAQHGSVLAVELRGAYRVGRMPAVWARLAPLGEGTVAGLRATYRTLVADQNRAQQLRMDARIQERRRQGRV